MPINITLGRVEDHITPSDRRAILSVFEAHNGFSTWFSMGGSKKYYLEIDLSRFGEAWYFFNTRRIYRGKLKEMKQHLRIETS